MTFLVTETSTTGDINKARLCLTEATARMFADRSPYRTSIVTFGHAFAVAVEGLNDEDGRNVPAWIAGDR